MLAVVAVLAVPRPPDLATVPLGLDVAAVVLGTAAVFASAGST